MKILHTSDWHLGRTLYGKKRYEEFSKFLDWLITIIEKEKIDILLVAGDIFDTTAPSNKAQELYYQFLTKAANSCCAQIVITSGNHDSPSFLNAPKELLKFLNVHVVSSVSDNLADEILTLIKYEKKGDNSVINFDKSAIICAVPYLRDRDLKTTEAGETIADKNRKLALGIKEHYQKVVELAEEARKKLLEGQQDKYLPIIAMGHLFTTGGKKVDGDGVRELYVGSLLGIGADSFPRSIDYLALGHLHVPQMVGDKEQFRYCGSPIAMGYGELAYPKEVLIVEFEKSHREIREILVPSFQELVRIKGDYDEILEKIKELKAKESKAWLEIEYSGKDAISNLRELFEEQILGSGIEIRRIKNQQLINRIISKTSQNETLDDLTDLDVFKRCLDLFEISEAERKELLNSYQEIVKEYHERDRED